MPEILSPCGSMESFYAAIEAGCDAVYLAGKMFGARGFANNFTDEEFNAAKGTISGEVSRNKGLGSLSAEQAHNSMFTEEFQRLEVLEVDDDAFALLEDLMGENVLPRKDFVFEKVDFSEIKE